MNSIPTWERKGYGLGGTKILHLEGARPDGPAESIESSHTHDPSPPVRAYHGRTVHWATPTRKYEL